MIDANVLIAFALDEPHGKQVGDLLVGWEQDGTSVHAPVLAQYEIASVLTRNRVHVGLIREKAEEAQAIIEALPVAYHEPGDKNLIVDIAVDLQRHSAYDAAYLALAKELDGELWTLDGPLARNAAGRYPVNLID